jgi:CRP/FNR family transcriptional regulator
MVSRGQTLVWEGDESLSVVANVIQACHERLKLSVSTQDGREQIVGVVFPSDFIGRPLARKALMGSPR